MKKPTGKVNVNESNHELMTFGDHLDIFRKMICRIMLVIVLFGGVIFYFKDITFSILLAPRSSDFITFRFIENVINSCGIDFRLMEYSVPLISTELSSQFMTHITVSCVLATLLASPYILFELFRFVSPALYRNEKKYSHLVAVIIYGLFILGLLMSYFILFPISFQFLATYQVDDIIINTITLDSYISTFLTLTFMMGIVFQLPVLAFILGKMGIIDAAILRKYRPYAFVIIMIIAAIITPPDLFTLIIMTVPIYGLYELSIMVLNKTARTK